LRAREDLAAGRIDRDTLRDLEDAAIREVVRRQEEIGLQSATDGEFRRASWHMDFIYQLDGISKEAGHLAVTFHNEQGDIEFTPAALHVDGKLGVSTTSVPKLTIPSPSMVHYRGGKAAIDPDTYSGMEEFWSDLTAAYREEIRRLGELGCTYLQLDDTSLAYINDPELQGRRPEGARHRHRPADQPAGALDGGSARPGRRRPRREGARRRRDRRALLPAHAAHERAR
jgi:5-methyltetrahydropteroyltriglutamate--homocysteine methyltransferase